MSAAAAALDRILKAAQFTVIAAELRRLLEHALTVELVAARREGAQAQKNHDAGLMAIKAIYCTGRDEQDRYRAFKSAETAIRDGGSPL